jgi:hypothetical protein
MRTRDIGRALALAGIATLAIGLSTSGAAAAGKSKQLGKLAAKECAQERKAMGKQAFAEKYGTNRNGRNAFGKCVSDKVGPAPPGDNGKAPPGDGKNGVNPAAACRAEREDPNFAADHGGKTFDQFYGTNPNLRNAFGKCVSSKASKPPGQSPAS